MFELCFVTFTHPKPLCPYSVNPQELFIRKVKRVYQEISENSFETNWEFLSVEDMKEKGWSENLGFRIKRAMLDFVLPVLGPILE